MQYIYQLFVFKKQIPKFSQIVLLYFISKFLIIDGALLHTINCCKLKKRSVVALSKKSSS